jgi:lipoyl(octanoyl) transferase
MARARAALLFDLTALPPTRYTTAWAWQRAILGARTRAADAAARAAVPDVVLALEHAPVYTLGRNASLSDLRFGSSGTPMSAPTADAAGSCSRAAGAADGGGALPAGPDGADVVRVDRGGKITYHGPGQLVVYPLLDLKRFREDLHWYVRSVEDVVIRALVREAALAAFRRAGCPGVWVGRAGAERKIAAVGMNASKWATAHGFAINVAPTLARFDAIVPCGIADRGVTSVAAELGAGAPPPDFARFTRGVLEEFSNVFDVALDARAGADAHAGVEALCAACPPADDAEL